MISISLSIFAVAFGISFAVLRRKKLAVRFLAGAALGLALVGAFSVLIILVLYTGPEERGANVSHVDWLPPEASDVTYFKRDGFGWVKCYECALPKEAFDRLCQQEGWKVEPKTNVSTGLRMELSPPQPKTAHADVIVIDLTSEPDPSTVKRALFYEKRWPNSGGVTVIYDLDKNRLFVHESHR